jgi:hypothetical protein
LTVNTLRSQAEAAGQNQRSHGLFSQVHFTTSFRKFWCQSKTQAICHDAAIRFFDEVFEKASSELDGSFLRKRKFPYFAESLTTDGVWEEISASAAIRWLAIQDEDVMTGSITENNALNFSYSHFVFGFAFHGVLHSGDRAPITAHPKFREAAHAG